MQSLSFGNFQVGIVDNPSIENKGGFEFASGMDIFSEPGVMKASYKMVPVTFGTGATPTAIPIWMVDSTDASDIRAYLIAGAKILESTDGASWNLFLTNANGVNLGLGIFAGYVVYASTSQLGRAPVANAAAKNDSYQAIDSDDEYHPMTLQAGTLKFGAGRYVGSVDEAFVVNTQALKLVSGYRVKSMTEYLTKLFMGTKFGAMPEAITYPDASVFDWGGIPLSTGSALPDTPYPLKMLGMNALHSNGLNLFGFPGRDNDVYIYNGVSFIPHAKIPLAAVGNAHLVVRPGAVNQYLDTIIFAGDMTSHPGVFQMRGKALCQTFVPSVINPGDSSLIKIGFVKSSFFNRVIIGYYRDSDTSYHVEISDTTDRQNNAFVKTVWHRMETDKLKRWYGVKLNLKLLASGCSVAVYYRTARDASFTNSGVTISSTNQDKPVLFSANPRTREIQFKFVFTSNTTNTPELLSYDPYYDLLNTTR